jgi:hypothetical protein
MKTPVANQKCLVLILVVTVLIAFGTQGIGYGQERSPTITPDLHGGCGCYSELQRSRAHCGNTRHCGGGIGGRISSTTVDRGDATWERGDTDADRTFLRASMRAW